eukprot:15345680-Ditylum_brightwellii.AAC.1
MFEGLKTEGHICTEKRVIKFHVDAISDDELSILYLMIDSLEAANDYLGHNPSIFREDRIKYCKFLGKMNAF